MKKLIVTTAFIALSASAAHAAPMTAYGQPHQEDFPYWYLGLTGGLARVGDVDYGGSEIDMDNGYDVSASLGYRLTNELNVEIEIGLHNNDVDNNGSGNIDDTSHAANLVYFFPTGQLRPYLGAGLGLMDIDADTAVVNGTDHTGFYQILAGISYAPTNAPRTEWNVGFRHAAPFSDPEINGVELQDYDRQSLEAGVKLNF